MYFVGTDYAVEIFHAALNGEDFTCGLQPDTRLPMMHIDDCINSTVQVYLIYSALASSSG